MRINNLYLFKYLSSISGIIFLVTITVSGVFAQPVFLTGTIIDSSQDKPLSNVKVLNTHTGNYVYTSEKGFFRIAVNNNDRLFFTATGYTSDSLLYTFLKNLHIIVYLKTIDHILPGVTVRTYAYSQYQKDSMGRLEEFNAILVSPSYKTTETNPKGPGFTISLDRFSAREKYKRRAAKFFHENEKNYYTDSRYTPDFVQYYTGLKGDSLRVFMGQYRPDYKWMRSHLTDEDLVYYINEKLPLFFELIKTRNFFTNKSPE